MIFRYTILYVDDVAAAIGFYERAFLHEGGLFVQRADAAAGQDAGQAAPRRPVSEIAFETEDVSAAFDRAVAAGAVPLTAPRTEPWGQVVSYIGDPDGYLVEICSSVQLPSAGWRSNPSKGASRRSCAGAVPNQRLNSRVIWAWSLRPQSSAISAKGAPVASIPAARRARPSRRQ